MDKEIIKRIANELNIGVDQVSNTLKLLEEGSTVPFIARYRKEMTKGLDEEQIRVIQEEYNCQFTKTQGRSNQSYRNFR